ncbi:MAG: 4Fe-4S ferredoxin, partial [Treponema sp.]|nr:4Fe-4S ferredoxin [Treponema sp.]
MLSVSKDKINSLFEAIAKTKTLYLPVDNASGKANFEKWQKGTKLSSALKTVRSAKDFFFPKTEKMVGYKIENGNITVEDPRKELEDFVVFGVRACDAKAFDIFDKVYLEMTPTDSYYKNRRDHAIIVTLACSDPDKNCFCSSYDLDAANPAGDVSAWLAGGDYYFKANSDKGKKFLDSVKSSLSDKAESAVEAEKKAIKEKIEKLPFAHLDLSKFKNIPMMTLFNSDVWAKLSESCLGCGTCTYVCPSCMCFDVRDYDT